MRAVALLLPIMGVLSAPLADQLDSGSEKCTAPRSSYGLVTNGGFEDGLTPWQSHVSMGSVAISVKKNGHAYEGCKQLSIVPTSPATNGNRQVQVYQELASPLVGNTKYTLSFYQGRQNSMATMSTPVIATVVGDQQEISQGPACSGSGCTIQGSDGAVWQQFTVTFTPYTTTSSINFFFTWTDSNPNVGILLDEVSITAASG